jgi:hypothetical protein
MVMNTGDDSLISPSFILLFLVGVLLTLIHGTLESMDSDVAGLHFYFLFSLLFFVMLRCK